MQEKQSWWGDARSAFAVVAVLIFLSGQAWNQHPHPTAKGPSHVYSRARLAKHTGRTDAADQSPDMLLAIWGRVFNVTSGAGFYAPGNEYDMFPGHDTTKSMAIASTKRKHLDNDLEGIAERDLVTLNETYWGTYVYKYPIVGWYSDAPYDPADYDRFAGPWSNVSASISNTQSAAGSAAKPESKCPAKRAAKAVKKALASFLPAGLLGSGSDSEQQSDL
mmetsp:Transcript_59441/g.141628  ORF Transcript_59441/g.141628 Transcript_59441/m.141628 type:complete len:220 (-) Transcript_59441:59-718(-)